MHLIDLARFLAETIADEGYIMYTPSLAEIFTSSINNGVLIYHIVISSVCLHFPHAVFTEAFFIPDFFIFINTIIKI